MSAFGNLSEVVKRQFFPVNELVFWGAFGRAMQSIDQMDEAPKQEKKWYAAYAAFDIGKALSNSYAYSEDTPQYREAKARLHNERVRIFKVLTGKTINPQT